MSKLFSCFRQNKKTRDYSPQVSVRKSKRHSRDNNEFVYVDTDAGHQHGFNAWNSVKHVYRTEITSQIQPGKDNNIYNQDNERISILRQFKGNSGEFLPRLSNTENKNILYLTANDVTTEPQIKTVIKTRPQSSKNFRLGGSVKMMTYRTEDVNRSPMSAQKYVHQMPIRATKPPPVLTTANGRILMPLSSNTVRKLSTSSNNENKPVGGFPLVAGEEAIVAAPMIMRRKKADEWFPLSQGQEVIITAPVIGGGGIREKVQNSKSILRNEGKSQVPYNTYDVINDYYTGGMYPYGNINPYGRGNYRQPYYEDYGSSYSYSMNYPYSYGSMGGYYGSGFPDNNVPCCKRGRRSVRHVYAAQVPEITLPDVSINVGENSHLKKGENPLIVPEIYVRNDMKDEKPKKEFYKGSDVDFDSFAQQTYHENKLYSICFSPELCNKSER